MQVALDFDRQVDQRMPRQLVEHVVEKPDAGGVLIDAGAVEIDGDVDDGFRGGAVDGAVRMASHKHLSVPCNLDPRSKAASPWAMTEGLPDSLIPYDDIVQEALRAVVGRVLGPVAETGHLPGTHHFYITFKTQAPGVDIPQRLVERFPTR